MNKITTPEAAIKKPASKTNYIQALGILPVFILICALFAVLTPNFLTSNNIINVIRQASINIVLAAGMTFVILTGGIDLSVGSILGVTAVIAVFLSNDMALGVGVGGLGWISALLALAAGLGMGVLNGALVAFLDLPPFIVTLGTYTSLRGLAYLLAGGTTVFNSDLQYAWIGNSALGPVPWLVVIALLTIVISWVILRRTVLGVRVYATGGNMQAARLTGIKVSGILIFAYGISGFFAGLGGLMSASRLYSANGILGTGYELDAIAAVILGGTSFTGGIGSIWGTLVGALIIAVLNNGLTLMNVSYFWQLAVKGLVIIIAVTVDKLRTSASQRR